MRARLKTDVAMLNGGGIRSDRVVQPGPLTRRDVASLLPFGNVVVVLEVTGRQLREALEHGLAQRDREGGGFLQIGGVALTFDPSRAAGSRIVTAKVGDAPLDPERRYTAAVVEYLVRGGDGFTSFRDARVLTDAASGPILADVLLAPVVDGRIRATQ